LRDAPPLALLTPAFCKTPPFAWPGRRPPAMLARVDRRPAQGGDQIFDAAWFCPRRPLDGDSPLKVAITPLPLAARRSWLVGSAGSPSVRWEEGAIVAAHFICAK